MRKILLPFVIIAGLFFGAMPAQAGNLSWNDPAGDASIEKGVIPSDDAVDILKTTVHTNAKSLQWNLKLKKAVEGNPSGSVGYFFIFEFAYNDALYNIRVAETVAAKEVTFRKDASGEQNRECKDCKYKFDRKASVVSVEAPIASLAEAIKGADAKAEPFKAGSTITKLLVNSYRGYIGISLRADDAPAPEGTEFKI